MAYSDPGGNSPLKWYHWLAIGVGVALIAVSAGLAFAPAAIGAFGLGALIGSVSVGVGGALIGGAIGYAVNGTEGMLQGVALGFGIGALIGFAVGGIIGYVKYPQAGVPLKSGYAAPKKQNGVNPRTIKFGRERLEKEKLINSFKETLKTGKINEQIKVDIHGTISNGNHRLFWARVFKLAVDVIIGN